MDQTYNNQDLRVRRTEGTVLQRDGGQRGQTTTTTAAAAHLRRVFLRSTNYSKGSASSLIKQLLISVMRLLEAASVTAYFYLKNVVIGETD